MKPLKLNLNQYQEIFSSLPMGVILQDEEGLVAFANQAAENILGIDWAEDSAPLALAAHWQAINLDGSRLPPEESPGAVAWRSGRQVINQRLGIINSKNNACTWVNVTALPIFEAGGSRVTEVFISLRDLTAELKQAEQAQRATSILEKTFASLKDAVFIQEYPGWKILSFNEAALEIFGYSSEELAGQSVALLHVNPAMFERFGQMATPFLLRKGVFYCEYLMRRKDGSLIITENTMSTIVDPQGGFQGGVNVVRDITTRKRSEYQISQYAMQLKTLTNLSQRLDEVEFDQPAILDRVAGLVAKVVGDICAIFLNTEDGDAIFPAAIHHVRPDLDAGLEWGRKLVIPLGGNLLGNAFRSRQAVLLPELDADALDQVFGQSYRWIAEKIKIHSLLMVPLRTPLEAIGMVVVVRDQPGTPFTAADQGFLGEIADRVGLSIQNARMVEATRQQSRTLRELAGRLSALEEAERRALARELHDQVSQYLTALSIDLQIIQSQLPPGTPALAGERVLNALEITSQTSARIRDVMANLRPAVLDDYGLEAALRWLANRFTRQAGPPVQLVLMELKTRLPFDKETALFRIAQEALANIYHHARCQKVQIQLESRQGLVRLLIHDDGVGFNPAQVHQSERGGWGILIMRERALAVGGHFDVRSTPDGGTIVQVEVTV